MIPFSRKSAQQQKFSEGFAAPFDMTGSPQHNASICSLEFHLVPGYSGRSSGQLLGIRHYTGDLIRFSVQKQP
jgi:hypothetical protein